MSGVLRIAALMIRTNRGFLLGWSIGVIALVVITIPGYAASYPSLASRGPLVEQLRATQATKVLYGVLPLPGTLGELAQWETGTYVMLLLSTMGLLLAVRLGRGLEQSGAAEIIRAAGTGRLAPVAASYLVQAAIFATIGSAIAVDMIVQSRLTPEVTIVGGLTFAATFPLVGLGIGIATSILGEVFPDRTSTRRAAWVFVAVEFGLRVPGSFGIARLVVDLVEDLAGPVAAGPDGDLGGVPRDPSQVLHQFHRQAGVLGPCPVADRLVAPGRTPPARAGERAAADQSALQQLHQMFPDGIGMKPGDGHQGRLSDGLGLTPQLAKDRGA